jgi:hypothetical protein
VEINRLQGDRAALWSMPSIPGVAAVNIGDPSFRFPTPPLAAADGSPMPGSSRRPAR